MLQTADFGFSDPQDNHNFVAITIGQLNASGALTLSNQQVSTGDIITVDDINAGLLTYTPASLGGTHQFGFSVQDNGPQSVNNIDPTENTISFDLVNVNDPPMLINNPFTVDEGSDNIISTSVLSLIHI